MAIPGEARLARNADKPTASVIIKLMEYKSSRLYSI
jgi:hypothetical protein